MLTIRQIAGSLIVLTMLAASSQSQNVVSRNNRPVTIVDVKLSNGGLLTGHMVSSQGQRLASQSIQVLHNEQRVATVKTDDRGRFVVRGLRSGLQVVQHGTSKQACRFWSERTAPPAARESLLMVNDGGVVRAQGTQASGPLVYGGSLGNGAGSLLSGGSGFMLGSGIVATAGILGGVVGFNYGLDRTELGEDAPTSP